MDEDPLVYEVAEVAQLLEISDNSTYAAIHRGEIPSIRVGRQLLVPRRALHALLETPAPNRLTGGAVAASRGDDAEERAGTASLEHR